ncbi:hypothetical protein JRI60_07850 [Archangium violaceum]|jgi:agmatine/peptidylarginine deiminase|uniref:hypothetical protein n=1 Tax=Archangium violaceum TaxID=83451 RepID=UPI00194F4247|nr:hypothetical protein [Archangium violaceum]QRN98934.1 hypothetical protein JRI60_07850 [Archangium violaceum]
MKLKTKQHSQGREATHSTKRKLQTLEERQLTLEELAWVSGGLRNEDTNDHESGGGPHRRC